MPAKKRRTPSKPGASRTSKQRWPLADGRYISTRNISPKSLSTGATVDKVREVLGLGPGEFDDEARAALVEFQTQRGLPVTGVVTEADWDALSDPKPARRKRSAPPAGGVDGADEGDLAPVLDPPEGAE